MSDVNGATEAPNKSSAKPKSSNILKEIMCLMRKLTEKDISDVDQLINDKRDLEQEIQSKKQELASAHGNFTSLQSDSEKKIAKLQSEKEVLIDAFEKRFKNWSTEANTRSALEGEIAELKQQLVQADKTVSFLKTQLSVVAMERSDKEAELESTKRDLISYQSTLQDERQELELEYLDHEALATKFIVFVEKCHELAKRFFLTPLPDDLTPDEISTNLKQSGFKGTDLQNIPISNTVPSQYLRMATAERVIADKLCTHVFVRCYLPGSDLARNAIQDVLTRLSRVSPRGEAIFRLRLLSAYTPEEGELRRKEILESTLAEIVRLLNPLLFGPNSQEGFRSELSRLLRNGMNLWAPVQRSATAAEVDNDPVEDWSEHKDYETPMALTADQAFHVPAHSDPIMSLFPRVSIGSDDICKGYALWSTQATVVAANVEYNQPSSRASTYGRTGFTRRGTERRKLSLSSSSAGWGRPENMSTSPTSPSRDLSFLGRTNGRRMASQRLGESGGSHIGE